MLYAGLDLSRKRLDVHILDEDGRTVEVTAVSPDAPGLRRLAAHVLRFGDEVDGAIESMTGARFVHDTLERYGWDVAIADAAKVKGIAPLAAKTDRIDARVLAELARLELVPEIWLPNPTVRAERERARFRLHLVHHRTALKNRIHATLMTFGHPVPVADLFGVAGREVLARLALPEPWSGTLATSLRMVDELGAEIDACEAELRRLGADHPSIPRTRSPRRSATSAASRAPRSSPGTPGCAQSSGSRATVTSAGRSPRTARSTCAGRSSRPPPTPPGMPTIASGTSGPSGAWAASVARRSPASTSLASSPKPSGTSSRRMNRLPRQAPRSFWSLDDPRWNWAAGAASYVTLSFSQKAIER
jgi:transposase